MSRIKTYGDYINIGKRANLRFIDNDIPKRTRIRCNWECKKGHVWHTTYVTIRDCNGCGYCLHTTLKKTKDDYIEIGKKNNIIWIGDVIPKDTKAKTQWLCKNNHIFDVRYGRVKNGHSCPQCLKKDIFDYLKLAIEKNLTWLGEELPKNTHIKTRWLCNACNKIWKQNYKKIKCALKCPSCTLTQQESLAVRKISKYLNQKNIPYIKEKRFKTCRNKKLLPFDFHIEDKILVEYDGEQHFRGWAGSKQSLEKIQKRDKIKDNWCIENDMILLRIPYTDKNYIQTLEKFLNEYQII